MTIDEMIAVLRAEEQYKEIQYNYHGTEDWHTKSNRGRGYWNFAEANYRVKPEPREWRVAVGLDGDITGVNASNVRSGMFSDRHYSVLVREVL